MPTKLTPDDFAPEFGSHLTTQEYGGGPRIDGVKLMDLRLLTDDGGMGCAIMGGGTAPASWRCCRA